MKKGGKAQPGPETKQYQPECIDYARFYLEQLFNYLVLALGSENQSRSSTHRFPPNGSPLPRSVAMSAALQPQ